MIAPPSIDLSGWLSEHLAQASPDLLRSMVKAFAEALMGAEADAVCGAGYGERSPDRVNSRNGYRAWEWDTRTGTIEVVIGEAAHRVVLPGLADRAAPPRRGRSGHRRGHVLPARRQHTADGETGRDIGIDRLSRSQVSEMARHLDGQVAAVRTRPLDAGPYRFVAADALVIKVREDSRTVNVHAPLAVGVNAEGYREILGLQVTSARTAAADWRSSAPSPPAASTASHWSPPTPTPAWSQRSARPCPERRGSGAAPTTRRT